MIWVYEELIGLVIEIVGAIFSVVSESVLSAFTLDPAMFDYYIPYFSDIQDLIQKFGIALCTFIALIVVVKNLFVMIFEEYEEPFPLALKYTAALLFCIFSKQIVQWEFNFFSGFYQSLIDVDSSANKLTDFFSQTNSTSIEKEGIGAAVATALGALNLSHLVIVALTIVLVIIVMLSTSYFKLLLEVAERYIVISLGMIFSPLIGCTIISKNTIKIFWSYLKMIFSQLLLMCMNVIFIRGALQCMGTAATPAFTNASGEKVGGIFIWFIFTMAFMRAGTAMDSYMKSLGLDVVQTGGSLFDAISGAASSLFYMSRSIGGIKGGLGAAGQAIGSGIGKFGTRIGNEAIAGFGNKMASASGNGLHGNDGIAAATRKAAENNLAKGAADASLYKGDTIANGVKNGLFQPLSSDAVNAAFPDVKESVSGMEDGKFEAGNGGLTGDLGNGKKFSLSQNESDGAVGITDAAGGQWWMKSTGDVPLTSNIGDVGETQSLADMCGVDASDLAKTIADGSIAADSIMGTNEGNGFISLADAAGNDLGSLNPDADGYNFIAAPNFSGYEEATEKGLNANTQTRALLGSGYSTLSSVALDKGGENCDIRECSVTNGVTTIKTSDQSIYKVLPSSQYTGNGGHSIDYGGSKGILVECDAVGRIPKSVHRRNIK